LESFAFLDEKLVVSDWWLENVLNAAGACRLDWDSVSRLAGLAGRAVGVSVASQLHY